MYRLSCELQLLFEAQTAPEALILLLLIASVYLRCRPEAAAHRIKSTVREKLGCTAQGSTPSLNCNAKPNYSTPPLRSIQHSQRESTHINYSCGCNRTNGSGVLHALRACQKTLHASEF